MVQTRFQIFIPHRTQFIGSDDGSIRSDPSLGHFLGEEFGRVPYETHHGQRRANPRFDPCRGGSGGGGCDATVFLHEFGYSESIIGLNLIEQLGGVKLHHIDGTLHRLVDFSNPLFDNGGMVVGLVEEVEGGYECGTGYEGGCVDDGLLDITLDGTEHGRVDDAD